MFTRVSRHGSHLVQITRLRLSNCYLVREEDGLTLVDSSVSGSAGAVLAAADDLGAPIRRVCLTHAHHDHAGSLAALRDRLPNAELAIGARESRLLRGELAPEPAEPRGRLYGFLYEKLSLRPDRLLDPGDRVGSLEVVDAAGHTPGQLAFFDTRDRTLICGDAYLAVGKVFVTTELVARFPFPALLGTWHGPTALATARALRDLEPARLASGHGPVVEAPTAAMDAALARAGG